MIALLVLIVFSHQIIFSLDKVQFAQEQVLNRAIVSQKTIDNLDDETRALLREYRLTLKKIHNTQVYNQQLREFIKNQKAEAVSLRRQIEEVKDTGKEILPLMLRMTNALETLIQLDVPFLLSERKERFFDLKSLMKKNRCVC